MINEFGYDNAVPNPPWLMRDQQNKCPECGNVFVGSSTSACPRCAKKEEVKEVVE